MFFRPCMVNMADELLSMFKMTMRKRKFPFGSKEKETNQAEDIELTRRMSASSRLSSTSVRCTRRCLACFGPTTNILPPIFRLVWT